MLDLEWLKSMNISAEKTCYDGVKLTNTYPLKFNSIGSNLLRNGCLF